jgi:glycosyltransferase involved in cell wall biosynthesis
VIAAAHGGLPEIVEDGESGTLFPPNNAEALAGCIRESLRNPEEIERRGAAALARFEAKFDTNTMWHRIQEAMCKWSPALAMSAVAPSPTAHLPR